MIFNFENYREYLKAVLAERSEKNKLYSLRAMAKALGVSPSLFSEVMKGKKNFSDEKAVLVANRLGLTKRESEYFCLLVQFESAKEVGLKDKLLLKIKGLNPKREINSLDLDTFKAISDWYHIPILVLADLKAFEFTERNISKLLKIPQLDVNLAISRLERLGMLVKDDTGRYIHKTKDSIFKSKNANEGLRNYHRQMLEKAIVSLESQTNDEKFVGSETFGFDSELLPEASQILEECFERMVELSKRNKKSHVYHLGIQLFRLTNKK